MNALNMEVLNTVLNTTHVLITFFLFYFAYYQIKKLNSVNNATFIQSITSNFNKAEVMTILTLLYSNSVKFETNDDIPIFKIDINKTEKIYPKLIYPEKGYYTAEEMDFYVLNNLDDVGLYVDRRLIKLQDAHTTFGWYVNLVMNNKAIKSYFDWQLKFPEESFTFIKLKQLNKRFETIL